MRKIVIALFVLLLIPISFCFDQQPKRKFVLVGGGSIPKAVKDKFVQLAGGTSARIVVIPSASGSPILDKSWYFHEVRCDILHTTEREVANSSKFCSKLTFATGVWMPGGDQERLAKIYGGTRVVRELNKLLDRGGVVGGTSAGASIISKVMMYEGEARTGFGLMENIIIDQHFNTRHRLPRLVNLVQENPNNLGIGIDESTALCVTGNECEVIGDGNVTVCDVEVKKYKERFILGE